MAFAEPAYLVLLAAVLPLGVLFLWRQERRRRAALEVFAERPLLERYAALPGARRRRTGQALALLALALVLLALARPRLGEKPMVLSRTGRDVLFVLDLSRSMNAEDVGPSRLEAAKRAVREILESSPGDRVGLEVFGGSAFLQVPLTLDRGAFELFLDSAGTDDVSDPGTNLASALATAATAFGRDSEPRYRVAVLLSDGENLQGDPDGPIRELRRGSIRVFTVGVGTPEGAPIPTRGGARLMGYHRDASGEVVVSHLEEDVLRRVARETDGSYVRLGEAGGVRRLASELAHLEKREISSRTFTQLMDRYQWPLALALAALILESFLAAGVRRGPARGPTGWAEASLEPLATSAPRRPGPRRRGAARGVALLVAGLTPALAPAVLAGQERSEAERLYRKGRYQEAFEAFRRLAEDEGPSPVLDYDAGNALYRLGRYDEAARSYRDALAGEPGLRQMSEYNLGNALFKFAEGLQDRRTALRRAVTAYEEALVLRSGDAAAKWNLELALRKLKDEEWRQSAGSESGRSGRQAQEGGGNQQDQARGGAQAPGGVQSPSARQEQRQRGPSTDAQGLTDAQARQLLEAIQSEEGEALENRNQGRARINTGTKDW